MDVVASIMRFSTRPNNQWVSVTCLIDRNNILLLFLKDMPILSDECFVLRHLSM